MTVSVESAATSRGTGRGSRTAATPSRITARGARTAATSRRRTEPRRNSPHSASAATHVTRNAIARSPLRSVSASSTFETGASRVYSVGRTRSTSAGGAPLTASTRPGKGERAESKTSAMSVKAIGWRRDRKSTRLNSSHSQISYAVFCLKKKKRKKKKKQKIDNEHERQRAAEGR